MLKLKFETDVGFHSCKRCGRHLIMKVNYDTNNCDKILDEQTKICQEPVVQENYKAKAADNAAVNITNVTLSACPPVISRKLTSTSGFMET